MFLVVSSLLFPSSLILTIKTTKKQNSDHNSVLRLLLGQVAHPVSIHPCRAHAAPRRIRDPDQQFPALGEVLWDIFMCFGGIFSGTGYCCMVRIVFKTCR